jgi:hypothetical protein
LAEGNVVHFKGVGLPVDFGTNLPEGLAHLELLVAPQTLQNAPKMFELGWIFYGALRKFLPATEFRLNNEDVSIFTRYEVDPLIAFLVNDAGEEFLLTERKQCGIPRCENALGEEPRHQFRSDDVILTVEALLQFQFDEIPEVIFEKSLSRHLSQPPLG